MVKLIFSLVLKSLCKGKVIVKIVDSFERIQCYFRTSFSSAVLHLRNSLRFASFCLFEKRSLPSPLLSFAELSGSWEPRGIVTCFSPLLCSFAVPLLLMLSLCFQAFVSVMYTQVCVGGRRIDFILFSDKHFEHSWAKLTRPSKRTDIQQILCKWVLSYSILLAEY